VKPPAKLGQIAPREREAASVVSPQDRAIAWAPSQCGIVQIHFTLPVAGRHAILIAPGSQTKNKTKAGGWPKPAGPSLRTEEALVGETPLGETFHET
jgi:hypothetical protein